MSDPFTRYHCQMVLPGFGESTQERLKKGRVLIVGVGGLGCPSAQYLASAGIGRIGLADDDLVSERNLHRQILFSPDDVGLPKVEVAAGKLRAQNPDIEIIPYKIRVTSSNVMELIRDFDLVIEGTDNFETKYLLNDACVIAGKPLVYGAIYQYEGQMAIWNVLQQDGSFSPNYRDVFPDAESAEVPDCSDGGVIPTLAGIVGCMQANEAIKFLSGSDAVLVGKLWMIDLQQGITRAIKLKKSSAVKIDTLTGTIPTIDIRDLRNMHAYQLIDVRGRGEHEAFNIGGCNIPLDELGNRLEDLAVGGPIICYCSSGKRSVTAARMILKKCPDACVYSLSRGIAEVREATRG
jgi:adenylyltransferase/sulfurtransferase